MHKLISAFSQNNINVFFVEDKYSLLRKVRELVGLSGLIAFAGSQTVIETGVRNYYMERRDRYKIIDPYEKGLPPEEAYDRRRQTLLADILITGSNAITKNGEIVNMDNQGNRVAGICFGPRKVIIIVGVNKIVENVVEARRRISQVAAPMNNKRLRTANPCEATGKCENCRSPKRICRIYTVVNGQTIKGRLNIIVVNEKLGY